MARLPTLALVLAGLWAGIALLWRARREAAGFRLPWLTLGLVGLIDAVWIGYRATQAAGSGLLLPQPWPAALGEVLHLLTVPFVVVSLLRLPHPPADRRRHTQTVLDSSVAALGFAILYWQVVLPYVTPTQLPGFEASLAIVQATCAVVLSTVCIQVLARARQPGGLPFGSVGPLAIGMLIHVVGLSLLQMTLLDNTRSTVGRLGLALAVGGSLLTALGSRTRDPHETRAGARRREATAALAPIVPLILVGTLIATDIVQNRPIGRVVDLLGVLLLVALLVGSVLTRLESLEVSRTLEDRVSERTLALGTREKWFRALVSNASDVVTVLDRDGVIRYQTPSVRRVLGHDPERMVGIPFLQLLPSSQDAVFTDAVHRAGRAGTAEVSIELTVWHRDGHYVATETTVTSLVDDPDIRGVVLTTRDVSEQQALQEQLTRQAYSDQLTGLANRTLFRDRIEVACADSRPGGVAVLFLDLDGFKGVNDAQGHATGDRLLALVATRLRNAVRPQDMVARLGGDEFGVLVTGEDAEKAAVWVAHRVRRVLANDFRLGGHEITVGASIGISVNVRGDESADQLLRNADLAMYRAKSEQRQAFVVFETQMHDAAVARMEAEAALRQAVARGELVLHYQPIVELATGRVTGVEALLRWQHPVRGLLTPSEFIDLAEETGLVEEIGAWALEEACRAAVRWQPYSSVGGHFRVAVNVSARQLTQSLPRRVRDALVKSGLAPGALILEMTESVLMERSDAMVALLKRFKLLGVRLAVDDFGTGYSSLSYLSRFPVDILKIDRSFVEQIGHESQRAELARTIVHLGQALRLVTVAEGIETADQVELLREMGCDLGQGYYFAAGLVEADVDAYLAEADGRALVDQPVAGTSAAARPSFGSLATRSSAVTARPPALPVQIGALDTGQGAGPDAGLDPGPDTGQGSGRVGRAIRGSRARAAGGRQRRTPAPLPEDSTP